jgi:hypothetical protein
VFQRSTEDEMPTFKPDIDKPKTESPDEGEVAPTLTKSDWMRFI